MSRGTAATKRFCSCHLPATRVYTNVWPRGLIAYVSAYGAPIAALSPDSAVDQPKHAPSSGSGAVSTSCSCHVSPARVKYTALPSPCATLLFCGMPTNNPSSSTPRYQPNTSSAPLSLGVYFVSGPHVPSRGTV